MRRRAQGRCPGWEGIRASRRRAAVRVMRWLRTDHVRELRRARELVRPADDRKRSRAAEDLPGLPEQRNDSVLFTRRKRPRSGTHLAVLGGTYGGSHIQQRADAEAQMPAFKVVLYLIPFWIAWYRKRAGKLVIGSLPLIFSLDFFLGWTVVGWFLALANACGMNPVAWFVLKFFKVAPGGAAGYAPQGGGRMPASGGYNPAAAPQTCMACGGSGRVRCSTCNGRGSWYDQPTTANGVAQLRTCSACMSSGLITCFSCGGSGRAAALI